MLLFALHLCAHSRTDLMLGELLDIFCGDYRLDCLYTSHATWIKTKYALMAHFFISILAARRRSTTLNKLDHRRFPHDIIPTSGDDRL